MLFFLHIFRTLFHKRPHDLVTAVLVCLTGTVGCAVQSSGLRNEKGRSTCTLESDWKGFDWSIGTEWLCSHASYHAKRSGGDNTLCQDGLTSTFVDYFRVSGSLETDYRSSTREDAAVCPISATAGPGDSGDGREGASMAMQGHGFENTGLVDLTDAIETFGEAPNWVGCKASMAVLNDVNLRGGLYDNVNFSYSDLTNTDFSDASLVAAKFQHPYDAVQLYDTLSDEPVPEERGGLYEPCAENASFERADMRYLTGFRMCARGANFRYADLRSADLSYADLEGADFSYALVAGADFSGANLDRANFTGTVFYDPSDYSEITERSNGLIHTPEGAGDHGKKDTLLRFARLNETVIDTPHFAGVNAHCAAGIGTQMRVSYPEGDERLTMRVPSFEEDQRDDQERFPVDLSMTSFRGSAFVDSDLRWVNLRSAYLEDVDLRGVALDNAELANAELRGALLCGASFFENELRQSINIAEGRSGQRIDTLTYAQLKSVCFSCSPEPAGQCAAAMELEKLAAPSETVPASLGNVNFMDASIETLDRSCELRRSVVLQSQQKSNLLSFYSQDEQEKMCRLLSELDDASQCIDWGFDKDVIEPAEEVFICDRFK